MKNKYSLSVVILLLIALVSCKDRDVTIPQPLTVNIKLLNEFTVKDSLVDCCYKTRKYIDNKQYEIQIDLINNTDSIIEPILMSCSWFHHNMIINTPAIDHIGEDCNSNYPQPIKIGPQDKYTYTVTLNKDKYVQESDNNGLIDLRIGLIFITDYQAYDSIMYDKSAWDVIWSNSIKLSKKMN